MRRRMMFESSTIISRKRRAWFPSAISGGRLVRDVHRQRDLESREAARLGGDADAAAQLLDRRLHDVHADATAGVHGHLLGGRKSWLEQQCDQLDAIERLRLLGGHHALAHRGGTEPVTRDAAAVILDA